MDGLPYWNHNSAYYPWIKRKVKHLKESFGRQAHILDVGCGDGILALYLAGSGRKIVGIDPDGGCIERATEKITNENVSFYKTRFEDFTAEDESFDAVIFTASLHHMNMNRAVEKADRLLRQGGILLIVGCARPSSVIDWIVEGLRVIPSFLSSKLHRIKTPEEINVPTSYDFPEMREIRTLAKFLPNAVLRQGLHYRYLLYWQKFTIKWYEKFTDKD